MTSNPKDKDLNLSNNLLNNNSEFYEQFNQSIITETNRIRADPLSYIPILELHKTYFKDNLYTRENKTPIETYEGVSAFDEAISFLERQKPVPTLTYDKRLHLAALDHVKDIGPIGMFYHDSTETAKSPSERVDKYCEWENCCCENIDLSSSSGVECIINLIVDDGNPDRTRRNYLFNEEFTYFGPATGPHKEYEHITVINLIGGIRDKDKPFFDKANYKYDYPNDLNMNSNSNIVGVGGFSNFNEYDNKEKKKYKSSYQLQDEDAPDGTNEVKMKKVTRLYDGKKSKVTKKYYTLDNGTHHIVEVEEL